MTEKKKKKTNLEKHIVKCEHCGKDVLDHMTQCPYCHGELHGNGYKPMTDEQIKKIRVPLTIIGIVVVAVLIILTVIK